MIAILVSFVAILLGVWYWRGTTKRARLPPGPKGIPIFGNTFQFAEDRFGVQLGQMGKNFGDAFTVKIFTDKFVILNTYEFIKEVMYSNKYAKLVSGRPPSFFGDHVVPHDAIFQTYSEEWASLRRVIIRGLKMYGSHVAEVEALVQEELSHVISRVQKEAGKAVDPDEYIKPYLISIVLMLLTGEHIEFDKPLVKISAEISDDFDYMVNPKTFALMTTFPWLNSLPLGAGKVYKRFKKNVARVEQVLYDLQKNRAEKSGHPCFFDFLFDEAKNGHIKKENIGGVWVDMFAAGIVTSHSALYSMFLILAARPDIQQKIQDEIDDAVGQSRLPCVEDKSNLPYTEAVLWEVLRMYPPGPVTTPHTTMEDVEIEDYFLPKGTQLFYNIWNVVHDEKFWGNPWEFDPTRFLDDEGRMLPPEHDRRQRMLAFGIGKRFCVGEVLARLRIFLACAATLQKFTLLPDPNSPLPDTDARTFYVALLMRAPSYKLIFQSRTL